MSSAEILHPGSSYTNRPTFQQLFEECTWGFMGVALLFLVVHMLDGPWCPPQMVLQVVLFHLLCEIFVHCVHHRLLELRISQS